MDKNEILENYKNEVKTFIFEKLYSEFIYLYYCCEVTASEFILPVFKRSNISFRKTF